MCPLARDLSAKRTGSRTSPAVPGDAGHRLHPQTGFAEAASALPARIPDGLGRVRNAIVPAWLAAHEVSAPCGVTRPLPGCSGKSSTRCKEPTPQAGQRRLSDVDAGATATTVSTSASNASNPRAKDSLA